MGFVLSSFLSYTSVILFFCDGDSEHSCGVAEREERQGKEKGKKGGKKIEKDVWVLRKIDSGFLSLLTVALG